MLKEIVSLIPLSDLSLLVYKDARFLCIKFISCDNSSSSFFLVAT